MNSHFFIFSALSLLPPSHLLYSLLFFTPFFISLPLFSVTQYSWEFCENFVKRQTLQNDEAFAF